MIGVWVPSPRWGRQLIIWPKFCKKNVWKWKQESPPAWTQEAYHLPSKCLGGRGYLAWIGGGVPILDGGGVPTLDGGYPSWGIPYPDLAWGWGTYLAQGGVPTLDRGKGTYHGIPSSCRGGTYLEMGEGYLPWGTPSPQVWTDRHLWKQYLPIILRTWAVIKLDSWNPWNAVYQFRTVQSRKFRVCKYS